jgi:hypothetical protein
MEPRLTVTVECMRCRERRDIGPGEIPVDEVPMCPTCWMPMVPVEARAEVGS